MLADLCVAGLTADEERCRRHVDGSTATATALVPLLGYERASSIAAEAARSGRTIRETAVARERRRDGGGLRRADGARGGLPPRLAGGTAMSSSSPRNQRLHIGFFGRRNVGKSSLLNAVTRQEVSIVSETPGTTTDPVEKPMELSPLGPVVFIDTAGVDDEGALGALRIEKTRRVLDRVDLAVLVAEAAVWGPFEEGALSRSSVDGRPRSWRS